MEEGEVGEVGRWRRGRVEEGEGRYETVPDSFPTGGASVGHI